MIEKSAGGLVLRKFKSDAKILMIRVQNLERNVVWTFPKGHLEKNETNQDAALREVQEETGWSCAIIPAKGKKYFEKVKYYFRWKGRIVNKEVVWFLMEPIAKTGEKDLNEIIDAKWFKIAEADRLAVYPSDKKLLTRLKDYNRRRQQWFGQRSSGTLRRREKQPH